MINKKFIPLLLTSVGILTLLVGVPNMAFSQSEEEILNSVGNELKSEADKKKAQAKIEKDYQALKSKADASYKSKKYNKAKEYYTQMLKLKPDSDYARNQIRLMEEMAERARLEKIETDYKNLITAADNFKQEKNWGQARVKYKAASGVKPEEKYPKDQLVIVAKLEAEAKAAAEAEALQMKYDAAIAEGDKAKNAKNWEAARQHYGRAAKLKPDESYPQQQLKLILELETKEKAEREQALLDKKYQVLITAGDKALGSQSWDEARQKYQLASEAKPAEAYPKTQLNNIDKLKAEYEAKKASEAIDRKYNAIIVEADRLLSSKKYEEATAKYKEAETIKPIETYPNTQIDKIIVIQKDLADAAVRAEKEKEYKSHLSKADGLFKAKDWEGAIAAYQLASGVLPDEDYPGQQIAKANENIKLEKDKEAKAAALEADFAAAMEKGNTATANENWNEAVASYTAALALKPKDSEATRLLAAAKSGLKSAEAEAAAQLAAEEKAAKLEKEYLAAVSAGDAAFKAKNWTDAKVAFNKAIKLKPDETYPGAKITEIDAIIAADAEAVKKAAKEEAERKAAQKENFENALAEYQSARDSKNWDAALAALAAAKAIFRYDDRLKKSTAELNKLMANEAAEKQRVADAEKRKAELDANYKSTIEAADEAFNAEKYDEAKAAYQEALRLKEDEQYPKDQLVVVRKKQEALVAAAAAAAEEERLRQRAIDDEYSRLMSQGEQSIQARDWNGAKSSFREAKKIKPSAMGPDERIAEIDRLMDREAEEKARIEEVEAGYNKAIEAAVAALDADNLVDAKAAYQQALTFKPQDEFARLKLAEVSEQLRIIQEAEAKRLAAEEAARRAEEERIRKEEEAKRRAEEEARRKAEVEARRLAELEENYSNALTAGDQAMEEKNYRAAVTQFKLAVELKPDQAYPADQLAKAKEYFEKKEAARRAREAERQRKLAEARKRREEEERRKREEYLKILRQNEPEELAKRYPNGITEEITDEDYRVITKTIIVEDGLGRYLLRFDYPWGQKFYYMNGDRITKQAYYWDLRKYR